MKKKYIKELSELYTNDVLSESDNKVWATGDCPEALGDSPQAEAGLKPDASGPGSVEGVNAPVDNDDDRGITNKEITQNKEKPEKKSENLSERSINNRTMSKTNNIFDKLYATIMEADDLDDENFDLGAGLGDEQGGDDLDELGIEDEAGSDVTITLTADEADLLKSIVGKLSGEDEGEGEGDEFEFGDDEEDPLMEGGETKTSGAEDGGKPKAHTGVMPHGTPGDNKVGGPNVRPKGGKASGEASGEEDGGKPKAHSGVMPHGKPGDNKVSSPGTNPGEFIK